MPVTTTNSADVAKTTMAKPAQRKDKRAEKPRPAAIQPPWNRFADQWEFLNASDEEIAAAARADAYPGPDGWPESQIDELNEVRDAFRKVYEDAAAGCPDLPPETEHELRQVMERLTNTMRSHGVADRVEIARGVGGPS